MPPKRAASRKKKKEVLPDPQTLPNGNCNYYIGAWSINKDIDALTTICHSVVEKHTQSDGEVSPLPKTVVLIPPATLGNASTHYAVEVADKLHVESIRHSSLTVLDTKPAADGEGGGVAAAEDNTEHSPRANEFALNDQHTAEQNEFSSLLVGARSAGASEAAREVVIQGTVHIEGIVPRIVIKPDLPEPPVVPKQRKGKSQKNSKQKEEEQKRLEEEAKMYEEKVQKAVAAAQKEEEYRMQFAHPDRWPKVQFTNVTFGGQVIVAHAHVKFYNCCFSLADKNSTQLLVAQYCRVECNKCSFENANKGCVYGWPMSELTLTNCSFRGRGVGNALDTLTGAKRGSREAATSSVGLHTDDSKVFISDSEFASLGTGILLRGTYPGSSGERPLVSINKCRVDNIYAAGAILDGVNGAQLLNNHFEDCEYYALDCVRGKGIQVYKNTILSKVRVQKGAQVKFMHNESGTHPLDVQEVENPNWQPVY
uniref:Right handed beta helix domain-containing protein n=1 Tax=Trypanosoma congolense (strain IL3000) TaxID=1068625 RepID=G0UKY8_TRYCI|nr:conserved hypothetical protein [Trypanosoma congolense IL3000]